MHELKHYGRLALMAFASFASMYVLMYAMVDNIANVYPNVNQLYMAALMTAPMVVIEIAMMGRVYVNKVLNGAIMAASVVALIVFWLLIRHQAAVSNTQFLKSMIPHHAGAILMCERAPISDPGIEALCRTIVSSQESEILQMKTKLNELENSARRDVPGSAG